MVESVRLGLRCLMGGVWGADFSESQSNLNKSVTESILSGGLKSKKTRMAESVMNSGSNISQIFAEGTLRSFRTEQNVSKIAKSTSRMNASVSHLNFQDGRNVTMNYDPIGESTFGNDGVNPLGISRFI